MNVLAAAISKCKHELPAAEYTKRDEYFRQWLLLNQHNVQFSSSSIGILY